MKIYDDVIASVDELCGGYSPKKLPTLEVNRFGEADKNELIFKSDTAFELGGSANPSLSGILLTDSFNDDEVILVGDNLDKIKKDCPYARITILSVDEDKMGKGPNLYQSIRKLDYTRYHIYPKGFMMRISALNEKETVIISKEVMKKGMLFEDVSKTILDSYHKNKEVKAVKLIFITDPKFNYQALEALIKKTQSITNALDHLLNKVKMDCNACGLQVICKEVEEKCKEDFPEK